MFFPNILQSNLLMASWDYNLLHLFPDILCPKKEGLQGLYVALSLYNRKKNYMGIRNYN